VQHGEWADKMVGMTMLRRLVPGLLLCSVLVVLAQARSLDAEDATLQDLEDINAILPVESEDATPEESGDLTPVETADSTPVDSGDSTSGESGEATPVESDEATSLSVEEDNVAVTKVLHPVILVPGLGGSQLEARLDKEVTEISWLQHWGCKWSMVSCSDWNPYEWFSIWLRLPLLLNTCLSWTVDQLRLIYDSRTHTTTNTPGVEVRVPGFGDTDTVEWLTANHHQHLDSIHLVESLKYYKQIVDELVNEKGYTRNVNIRGAPYDFRKAPNEMSDFTAAYVQLIEDTYSLNGNTPVVLMAHSMGNSHTLYLLQGQTQAWKDKYIKAYVALAGPFGGAVKTLRAIISGDNMEVGVPMKAFQLSHTSDPLTMRRLMRMPSVAWLMPYETFWSEDEVLVQAPDRNYTVTEYRKLFTDIEFTDGYSMRADTQDLVDPLTPPGVNVYCMYGQNVSTTQFFRYNEQKGWWNTISGWFGSATNWFDSYPDSIDLPDGDGTVNRRSLEGCTRWVGHQDQMVNVTSFDNTDHMEILDKKSVLDHLMNVTMEHINGN